MKNNETVIKKIINNQMLFKPKIVSIEKTGNPPTKPQYEITDSKGNSYQTYSHPKEQLKGGDDDVYFIDCCCTIS